MKFENASAIPVPCAKLWDYMTVIPNVAACLPGVEDVHALADGTFAGVLALKIGIIKLRLSGKLKVDLMDRERRIATMAVEAADQRISGMVQGTLTMKLEELTADETTLTLNTDLNLFGKIGEFGGPIIKKKADEMMKDFAKSVAAQVARAAVAST